MRFNPKAKLKVRQIKDLRTSGGQQRRSNSGTDGADGTSPKAARQRQEGENFQKYLQIPVHKNDHLAGRRRGATLGTNRRGYIDAIPDRPDSADRVSRRTGLRPAPGKPAADSADGTWKLRVKKRKPISTMGGRPGYKQAPLLRKQQSNRTSH